MSIAWHESSRSQRTKIIHRNAICPVGERRPTGADQRFSAAGSSASTEGANSRRSFLHPAKPIAHGGARGTGRQRSGKSVATTCSFPRLQFGQRTCSMRATRYRKSATDSIIAGSGGGTPNTARAAARPTFFRAADSKP